MLSIGKIIKQTRMAQKISQEALSDGICATNYLSRIESGKAKPSDDIAEKLMQRLGKDVTRYINFKNERDFDIYNLKYSIRRHYATGEYDLHRDSLNQLISIAEPHNKLLKQFIMLHTSFIESRKGTKSEEVLKILEEALKLTKKQINLLELKDNLLTQDEIIIINNIVLEKLNRGDIDQGINILLQLKSYLDHPRIDHQEKIRTYPIIICNLTKWLSKAQRYHECIVMCDKAMEFCIKNDTLGILMDANFNKGFALHKTGDTKQAIEYIIRSYHIAKISGNEKAASLTKEYVLDTFKLDLTTFPSYHHESPGEK